MRDLVRARVEIVIVLRLVDTHAPENDRRMIPVATHHAFNVIDRQIFPAGVADMLPTRNLLKHKQAVFVAGVKKVRRLRIV